MKTTRFFKVVEFPSGLRYYLETSRVTKLHFRKTQLACTEMSEVEYSTDKKGRRLMKFTGKL